MGPGAALARTDESPPSEHCSYVRSSSGDICSGFFGMGTPVRLAAGWAPSAANSWTSGLMLISKCSFSCGRLAGATGQSRAVVATLLSD